MSFTTKQIRKLEVAIRARKFAEKVRGSNMAFKLGDELIDWLKDDEIPFFKAKLERHRLVQRADARWEER